MKKLLQKLLFKLFPNQLSYTGNMVSSSLNEQTKKMEKTLYSAYAEYEFLTNDKKLFVRFVNTYGPERVPQGEQISNDLYKDGLIDWVGELYFINYSDKVLSVKPLKLRMMDKFVAFEEEYNIEPNAYTVTPPLRMVHSNYGTEFQVEFSFMYNGKLIELKSMAKRLTQDEVKLKYAKNN